MIRLTNNRQFELNPYYTDKIAADMDVDAITKTMFTEPIYTPLLATQPVIAKDDNGNDVDDAAVLAHLYGAIDDVTSLPDETEIKSVFEQSLLYYNKNTNMNMRSIFAVQSGVKAKLPEPSGVTVYTPKVDIIPTCKMFLQQQVSYDMLFGSFAFYAQPEALGVYFANEIAFNNFKAWFQTQAQLLAGQLTQAVNTQMSEIQKLSLNGLTESLILRNDFQTELGAFSFPRTLISLILQHLTNVNNPLECGLMPFDVPNLIVPKNLIFVNIEQHARSTPKKIKKEWDLIQQSIQAKVGVVNNKHLNKLTTATRNMQRYAAYAANGSPYKKKVNKAGQVSFREKPLKLVDMTKYVKRVLNTMMNVNKSLNPYKVQNYSYNRQNRRDPDNWDKMGVAKNTRYYPDIHVYLDTSGSISEQNYKDAIMALIAMTKKMNVSLYFNSFSDYLSEETCLKTKNKSAKQIYREFKRVPKITGGTDFEQVWRYINSHAKRTRRLSLMITDFGYYPPSYYIKHPNNLYYLPCSNMDWDEIKSDAEDFERRMMHNDPHIRKHMLL